MHLQSGPIHQISNIFFNSNKLFFLLLNVFFVNDLKQRGLRFNSRKILLKLLSFIRLDLKTKKIASELTTLNENVKVRLKKNYVLENNFSYQPFFFADFIDITWHIRGHNNNSLSRNCRDRIAFAIN